MTPIRVSSKRLLLFLAFLLLFAHATSFHAYAADNTSPYYTLSNEDDLELIRQYPDANFELVTNIVMTKPFEPIPMLGKDGALNGNGFTISGLEIIGDSEQKNVAFIQNNRGKIKDLGLVDVKISSATTGPTYWASGMVGINNGTIEKSYVTGQITGGRSAGITVSHHGTISDVYALVDVSAHSESAGLVAVANNGSKLFNSYAIADATSSNSNTAILVAYAHDQASIANNLALGGSVSNGSNNGLGRIVGKRNGTPALANNYAFQDIPVQSTPVTSLDSASPHGQNVSAESISDPAFYDTVLNWKLDRVWKLRERPQYPVLQTFRILQATEIASQADLEKIRANPAGDFMLVSDIVMDGNFEPIDKFSGTLDGNGFSIANLKINAASTQKKAAFIVENSGIIEHLGMKSVEITGLDTDNTYWASGLVARNTSEGIIRESYVTGKVQGGYRSAGIVVANFGQVENVYAKVNVQAKVESGGLIAVAEKGSSLANSYIIPEKIHSDTRNTGAVAAYAYNGAVIANTLVFSGEISNIEKAHAGRIVGRMNTNPDLSNNWSSYNALVQENSVSGPTGADSQHGETVADEGLLTALPFYEQTLAWDFHEIWAMSAELDHPVLRQARENEVNLIQTVADLEEIRDRDKADYQLANNLQLTEPFTPIAQFRGTLDGAGFAIVNLKITADTQTPKAALIIDQRGIIERLAIVNAKITGISDESSQWASGLAARNYGTIRKSYVSGQIIGGYRSAGLVVSNHGTVENVYADVTVIAKVESGGLVAVAEDGSSILRSYVRPQAVYSQTRNTGGVVAYVYENTTIANNVVLAGEIGKPSEQGAPEADANRIIGKINGEIQTMMLQNNWASSKALVHGQTVIPQEAADSNGITVNSEDQLSSKPFYEDTLGWNFERVWKWHSGLNLPRLRHFTGWYNAPSIIGAMKEPTTTGNIMYGDTVTDVTYTKMSFTDTNNNPQQVFVITVDPGNPNYQIRVGTKDNISVPVDSLGYYRRTIDGTTGKNTFKDTVMGHAQSTDEVLHGYKVLAGVNGEFYTTHGPEGHMIKNKGYIIPGNRVPGYKQSYPFQRFFGIRQDGTALIGNYADDWLRERGNLSYASGGQHDLVRDGYVQDYTEEVIADSQHPDFDWETYYRHLQAHPRTAVGIKQDGSVIFVVVDGRSDDATGMTIEQLAQLMKELEAVHATNMDGGGSSTAAIWAESAASYQMINQSSNEGGPREVFNSLLITVTE